MTGVALAQNVGWADSLICPPYITGELGISVGLLYHQPLNQEYFLLVRFLLNRAILL